MIKHIGQHWKQLYFYLFLLIQQVLQGLLVCYTETMRITEQVDVMLSLKKAVPMHVIAAMESTIERVFFDFYFFIFIALVILL